MLPLPYSWGPLWLPICRFSHHLTSGPIDHPIKHQLAKMMGDNDVEALLDTSEHTADLLSRDAQLAYFTLDPEEAQDYEALKP